MEAAPLASPLEVAPPTETEVTDVINHPQPQAATCWSAVLQKKPQPQQQQEPISSLVFGSCKSSMGISVAVVDANAIIHGHKLSSSADKFVSVREVLDEVRDPVSRRRLSFLPFVVETMEPSPEALKKVIKFARETGDLQTLSEVDLKLIALTYMLEGQIHGTSHLRDSPPPLHVVNVKKLPEAQMRGWGSNVPNLAEWEALEQLSEKGLDHESRILPLKELSDNVITTTETDSKPSEPDFEQQSFGRPRRFMALKKEIKIDGKKMVVDGIDASQGKSTDNTDDWLPAVGRSTHRKYLRRKARREKSQALNESNQPSEEASIDDTVSEGIDVPSEDNLTWADCIACNSETGNKDEHSKNDKLANQNIQESETTSALEQEKNHLDSSRPLQEKIECGIFYGDMGSDNSIIEEATLDDNGFSKTGNKIDSCIRELDDLEVSSQKEGSIGTSVVDDCSSEQSWMLRSLSESTVACITTDFAMQNVILQIGLRLLAPGGMQIRELHRWVLKCHACNKVTQEIGRIFCPKCGNGGTLRKVSVTVGENGIVLAARRQRFILRGTKFSLPLPQGGRDAITKNLILREDQLPRKLLYPKLKKPSKQDDFLSVDDIFTHGGEKRAPLLPPVRKALAVFSGKRNPNDNHFSRSRG